MKSSLDLTTLGSNSSNSKTRLRPTRRGQIGAKPLRKTTRKNRLHELYVQAGRGQLGLQSVDQLAQFLNCSSKTVRNMIKSAGLKKILTGPHNEHFYCPFEFSSRALSITGSVEMQEQKPRYGQAKPFAGPDRRSSVAKTSSFQIKVSNGLNFVFEFQPNSNRRETMLQMDAAVESFVRAVMKISEGHSISREEYRTAREIDDQNNFQANSSKFADEIDAHWTPPVRRAAMSSPE